ncbi:MAG TPA: hypothetical protein PLQ35_16055 [bacterium]|nr:hypothetical protein [bacterium]HQL63794.1 hypothetical protein [bacterium]
MFSTFRNTLQRIVSFLNRRFWLVYVLVMFANVAFLWLILPITSEEGIIGSFHSSLVMALLELAGEYRHFSFIWVFSTHLTFALLLLWPVVLLWVYHRKGMLSATILCLSVALAISLLDVHQLQCTLQHARLAMHHGETMPEKEVLGSIGPPLMIRRDIYGEEWIYTDGIWRSTVWLDLERKGRINSAPGRLLFD